ncbi:MAG: pyridoxal phosphate-dependent aminotransferase, partial [Myxococcota bacterium]
GSMHALFLLSSILGRDSEVVTTSPLFPIARNALEAVEARVHEVPLAFEEGYRLSPGAVASRLTPRTRLVSLATPQNPTGVASARTDLRAILAEMARVCPEAYLLVDETYREASYGDDAVAPTAIDLDERVITCAALSKCHGAPGLRVGWLITRDPRLYAQLEQGKATTVISLPPLNEALAAELLERQANLLAERRRALGVSLDVTERWVEAHSDIIQWVRPDAGALCCARLNPERVEASLMPQFHEQLGREGVRVSRGEWFRQPEQVFRLGFGYLPPDDLQKALDIVASVARTLSRA